MSVCCCRRRRNRGEPRTRHRPSEVRGRGGLMYDVICSRLSACMLYRTVLEATAWPWPAALWFGCPHRCLTDTTGVNISHRVYGGGLWW